MSNSTVRETDFDEEGQIQKGDVLWEVCEKHTIGRDVAILRTLLNLTQQKLADIILLNRITLNKLENSEDSSSISPDTAFRLYYVANEVMRNENFSDFTREIAQKLCQRIEQEILIPRRNQS